MELFFCLVVPILMFGAALSLTLGLRIWHSSSLGRNPAETRTLWFLGLNLGEPAVNMPVVTGLVLLMEPLILNAMLDDLFVPWAWFGLALGQTLPMAVLLLPVLGWNSTNAACRRINRRLVALGLLRWGVTALTLIWPPAFFAGILIFGGSLAWVSKQATALGSENMMVGEWSWRK